MYDSSASCLKTFEIDLKVLKQTESGKPTLRLDVYNSSSSKLPIYFFFLKNYCFFALFD